MTQHPVDVRLVIMAALENGGVSRRRMYPFTTPGCGVVVELPAANYAVHPTATPDVFTVEALGGGALPGMEAVSLYDAVAAIRRLVPTTFPAPVDPVGDDLGALTATALRVLEGRVSPEYLKLAAEEVVFYVARLRQIGREHAGSDEEYLDMAADNLLCAVLMRDAGYGESADVPDADWDRLSDLRWSILSEAAAVHFDEKEPWAAAEPDAAAAA